jgi:hypothetical protein
MSMKKSSWQDAAEAGAAVVEASPRIKGAPQIDLRTLPPMAKITNRAEQGNFAGQPCLFYYASQVYPVGANPEDTSTWLQPGESYIVSRDECFGIFGNVFTAKVDDLDTLANRFGGWEMEPLSDSDLRGRNIKVKVIGLPVRMPDIIVQLVDGGQRPMGKSVALLDLCAKLKTFQKISAGFEREPFEIIL